MYLGCFSIVTFFLSAVLRREGSGSGLFSKEPISNVNFGKRLLLRCDFDDFRASRDALRLDFRDFFCHSRDDEMLRYLILFDDFDDFRASGDAPRLNFHHSRDDEMRSLPLFDDLCAFFDGSGDDEMLRPP